MLVFLVRVDLAIRGGSKRDSRSIAATAMVNHDDADEATRIARTALAERGWLLRRIVQCRSISWPELPNGDEPLEALIAEAAATGVGVRF